MVQIDLMEILQEKNRAKFEMFLRSLENGQVSEEDEADFFKEAPQDWLSDYLDVTFPQKASERVLMVVGSDTLLQKSHDLWGFWDENVHWVFASGTHSVCERVLSCMKSAPGYEAEELMLRRNSRDLLVLWLEKFKSLSEDGERIICEDNSLQELKNLYIEKMITNPY